MDRERNESVSSQESDSTMTAKTTMKRSCEMVVSPNDQDSQPSAAYIQRKSGGDKRIVGIRGGYDDRGLTGGRRALQYRDWSPGLRRHSVDQSFSGGHFEGNFSAKNSQ